MIIIVITLIITLFYEADQVQPPVPEALKKKKRKKGCEVRKTRAEKNKMDY